MKNHTQKFLKRIYKKYDKKPDLCFFIMSTFDGMLYDEDYAGIIEIINAVDFTKISDSGVPLWLLISSNPISPLLRKIPKEDKVKDLMAVRCILYDKCKKYYDVIAPKLMTPINKPENYDELVKYYDEIYIGGAPKEE